MSVRLIIFDLDGTLLDTVPMWLDLFKKSASKFKVNISADEIKKYFGKQDIEIISQIFSEDKRKEVIDYFYQLKKRYIKNVKLFPDTKKVLSELKNKNIKIAIATGNTLDMKNFFLKKTGLYKIIDYSLCAEEVKNGKPNPDLINKIANYFDIDKKYILFVGDSIYDYYTAKNSKVKIGLVSTGVLTKEEIIKLKPDFVFDNLKEILDIIES